MRGLFVKTGGLDAQGADQEPAEVDRESRLVDRSRPVRRVVGCAGEADGRRTEIAEARAFSPRVT